MVRTRHILIFVLVLACFIVAFLVYGAFFHKGDARPVAISIKNPFVSESTSFTIQTNPEQNKKSIRESLLSKLGTVKHNALTFTSKEPPAKATPEPTEAEAVPLVQEFDWSSWESRIPEFNEKKIQYDTDIENLKTSLQNTESEKNAFVLAVEANTETKTPAVETATNGTLCFNTQIEQEKNIIASLEGRENPSLGVLYVTLIDEINLKERIDNIPMLLNQIEVIAEKNTALQSEFIASRGTCAHFLDELLSVTKSSE